MELPQPRPFGAEGSKSTHDFLSLYTHSSPQLDPRPSPQGGCLKTRDFLQPQERITKSSAKEETDVEKPPRPVTLPSAEHLLPGGIGTYSISHVSHFNQRAAKPEGPVFGAGGRAISAERKDDNSIGSSLPAGSGFNPWGQCAVIKKGKTGKENVADRGTEPQASSGQWTACLERPSISSSNNHHTSFSCHSSSQSTGKNQSFMDMLKSAKSISQDEELDDDDDFVIKKETLSANKGELRIKVDAKNCDQKASTPRSKHSATEQRRRSKINDRLQMLRGLIPHGEQKRDKASFLLEVVDYIQFLQEKVQKYEGPYQEWNHDMAKLMPLKNNQRTGDGYIDQSRGTNSGSGPALVFAAKFVEKSSPLSPNIPGSSHNPVDSDSSSATTLKAGDHPSGRTNNSIPFAMSVQPKLYAPVRSGIVVPQLPTQFPSDIANPSLQPQILSCQPRCYNSDGAAANEMQKEQDLSIEGGTISISSVYSQGLLNTLTHALQSSGVDLSQSRISVQIELGKRTTNRAIAPTSKDVDIPMNNIGMSRSRVSAAEDSEKALKKLKTIKS